MVFVIYGSGNTLTSRQIEEAKMAETASEIDVLKDIVRK